MTMISKRSWLFLLLAAFAGLAMLFAACGGDDNETPTATDSSGGDGSRASTTRTPAGTGVGSHEAPTATDNNGSDTGSAGDALDQLLNAAGDYEHVTGKVAYETSDTAAGTTGTFVLYSDADNKRSRFDSADGSGSFSIISTTDATYTCTASDASGTDGVCIKGPASDNPTSLGLFGFFASPALLASYVNTLAGIDVNRSSENIAGTDGECYSWEGTVEGESGSGKICFASNGLMLSADFRSSDGTDTHMKATDSSDHVSDSDFDPPYNTVDIPGQ